MRASREPKAPTDWMTMVPAPRPRTTAMTTVRADTGTITSALIASQRDALLAE